MIPSLFPFFAAVSLLLQLGAAEALQGACGKIMGPLFHMRGACALPLLAGLLGGGGGAGLRPPGWRRWAAFFSFTSPLQDMRPPDRSCPVPEKA